MFMPAEVPGLNAVKIAKIYDLSIETYLDTQKSKVWKSKYK